LESNECSSFTNSFSDEHAKEEEKVHKISKSKSNFYLMKQGLSGITTNLSPESKEKKLGRAELRSLKKSLKSLAESVLSKEELAGNLSSH